jgi:predicted ABC-type sugar transport system permease subunit
MKIINTLIKSGTLHAQIVAIPAAVFVGLNVGLLEGLLAWVILDVLFDLTLIAWRK